MDYREIIGRITPPDQAAAARCRARWNRIAKPLYGLGALEDMVVSIAAAQGTDDVDISRKGLVIFCADNGVVEEGVSQTGQETTAIVAENFPDGISCAAIMCKRAGADLFPVDVGIAVDTPRIEKRKCRYGTSNIAKGPAMTREEAVFALEAGIEKAVELADAGYRILASGEMGIGNTTTSAAVASVLVPMDPAEATGCGAGLPREGVEKKVRCVRRAIGLNRPAPQDPLDVLAKVGGLDIAALTGLFIGGAACRVPVVIDGYISAVAALAAVRLAPACKGYMLASHISGEPGTRAVMTSLGLRPVIDAGMHLGEGTGAVALFPLLDMACDVYRKMETFEEIRVPQYEDFARNGNNLC
ncbi:MAG: nicotinate-nucleotide--dimethylbenzimidazole phosphoribosyltransferase [Lachnospiraceae bacterium]|nr:nicotinate-nucleotide--dimethylbenzimidazole phosphoribosyltransferase [Lachnospiraceae bacterium]